MTDVQTVPAGLSLVSSDYPPGGWTTNVDATFVVNKVVKAELLGTWVLRDEAFAEGDTETWSSGEQTLTFTVYDIDVLKTAEPWWERSFDWTIEKSVEPTELILVKGGTGTVTYTITITKTVAGDQFKVYGTITIVNNNPEKYAEVSDKIYDGASVVASQDLGSHSIAPLATLVLDYEIFFTPEIGKQYINVAHVDLENYLWKLDDPKAFLYTTEFIGDAGFTFTEPTDLIDDSATVDEVETVPAGFSATVEWGPHGSPPWIVTDSTIIVFTKDITEVNAEICNWYDLPNTVTLTESDTGIEHEDSALVRIHVTEPPSFDFDHSSIPQVVLVGSTQRVIMRVVNTGPPESRIYFLTFTAVIDGYDFLQFVGPNYVAHVTIYYNNGTVQWDGDVTGVLTNEKFSGFGVPGDYWMVTWRVPTTYPDGPYLEGNDQGSLQAMAEVTFRVKGVAQGPTTLEFFPRATEDHHASGVPLGEISDPANIWESNGLWYPVHNSYDPYDDDIGTGHIFQNPTWMAVPTADQYMRKRAFIFVWA